MFCIFSAYTYEGKEIVDDIYSNITDLNNPTIEELQGLEEFLKNGERLYLNPIGKAPNKRNCRTIKLVGENGEEPIRKLFTVNTTLEDKKRCIVLYASFNYPYPEKVKLMASELKKCGYKGHILLRIGGYPNMQNEGLKLAHIPYSRQIASLLELRSLGYTEILWIDTAMKPLNDVENIFKPIRQTGRFYSSDGFTIDYPYSLGHH